MAKNLYIGVNGAAKKAKKIYIGVNGVAKKVKKAYIGVNGVAKQCYTSEYSVVNLNSQWIKSSTQVSGRDVFQSNSNYHIASSVARCIVTFTGFTEYTLMCRSYGESGYDYLEVGNLDVSNITRNGSNKLSLKSKASASTYTEVTWTGLDGGTHFVEIIYSKDSSVDSNDDRGFFYIPNGEVIYQS